jgi:dihydroorotate dehydrogenase
MNLYSILRPLLFRLQPETAHKLTLSLLRLTGAVSPLNALVDLAFLSPEKPVTVFSLRFKNPIGLAAGYDKDGVAIRGLAALGFGHIEIGTVTPRPQSGNPKPRIFRLPQDEALINRMGFPSQGGGKVVYRLRKFWAERAKTDAILGVNLGRNKDTPNEEAAFDYLELVQLFAPLCDYMTVNVSSPNTIGLRQLQARQALENLLTHVNQQRRLEQAKYQKRLPLLVKLSPDLTDAELDDALEAIWRTDMDGVIATNTTLARQGLVSAYSRESGGLSGAPLRSQSEALLSKIVRRLDGRLPVISSGGIMTPEDAKRRLDMGAALVQVYTGLIYAGPGLVRRMVKAV